MKISLDWLSDFVAFTEKDPHVIASRLTEATGEVEEIEEQAALLRDCCVGKVVSISKHPNADKLLLADVETDRGTKRVVCGGTNLRVGMMVAFAHTGATVRWHGTEMMTLQKTKIRGEESEGMICAAEELDLGTLYPPSPANGERPIVDLGDADKNVGKSLKEFLNLTDVVFHIDNHAITHRADLFSHMGVARECVALGLGTWKKPKKAALKYPKTALPFKFVNEIPKLLPRYDACLLSIESLGDTPQWMKKRLEATGWRSISLPIDITNYVAMEFGVPLHSFDAGDFAGDVHARTTKEGETIMTLDGVDRELPEGTIVLSDDQGIFDLLGIMGGLRSSTKETTKSIYLHAATVDPVSIRRTIIATGHRTDAATVYEKGVPKVAVRQAFERAVELFLELVPGAKIVSKLETQGDDGKPLPLTLDLARVNSMLGTTISAARATTILNALEFTVKAKGKTSLIVTPPLHRNDIRGEHDLVEEIGRVEGYNAIPTVLPVADVRLPLRDTRITILRNALKEERYLETLPLSLVGSALLRKSGFDPRQAVEVGNPLGEELSLMRPAILPSLLEHASRNMLLVEKELRTFHWGRVFHHDHPEKDELTMMIAAKGDRTLSDDPFLLVKSHLTYALMSVGYKIEMISVLQTPTYAHPGRFASFTVMGTPVGSIYEVHPDVCARFDLSGRTAAATLDLTALLALPASVAIAASIPQFPAITYDETLTLTQSDAAGDLLTEMQRMSELLESVRTVDLYQGKSLKGDQYNLTVRFTYRAPDRTLTEDEAQKEHSRVLAAAKR